MHDEVSVAEILEREGWDEAGTKKNGRMRTMAVMFAVVMGCGLAALLVHFGSQAPQGDSALLGLPHPPPGGLAGGGVPSDPATTEVTATDTTVVVTEETTVGGTIGDGIPWHSRTRASSSTTVTATGAAEPTGPRNGGEASLTTTNSTIPGGTSNSTAPTSTTPKPPNSCVLLKLLCW